MTPMSRTSAVRPSPAVDRAIGATAPLSAWQRWEMSAIAEAALAAVPDTLQPLAPVVLMDEAELALLRLQAQRDGEAAGHLLGYAQGQAQGRAEGHAAATAAVHEQAEQLRELTVALPAALRSAEREVANDLLALALDIARQVLGQALTLDPQAILLVVRELLQAEPALTGNPQLVLHPDDAALVKEHLAEDLHAAGWRVRTDAQEKRGGCRVLAVSGERDASLDTRWERVAAALARSAPGANSVSVVHGE